MKSVIRLLSPNHRRLVSLNTMSLIDQRTDAQLREFGWIDYLGPGEADDNGWFIADSDPQVQPAPQPSRLTK